MSQLAALAQMDADLHAALADAGMADTGAYTPPAPKPLPGDYEPPAPIAVRCYVDRDIQRSGQAGQVVGRADEVGLLLADLSAPAKGGTLVVDGQTLVLDRETGNDGSVSRWTVHRG